MSDINVQAQGDLTIGGDVVGRDKIVNNIQHIQQRALTAAEAASGERALETQVLAQGVSAFATRLQAIASETSDGDSGSPYKGLIAYRLSDVEIFFGRSAAIASLLKRLGRGALTVLHSESGAGKSSLLQAGISPRLIGAGHLPLFLRPYNANPTYIIKRAFIPDLGQTPWLATAPLREFLRQVSEVLGPKTTLYLILDQAEELFTQLGAEDRAEFVAELAECVNDGSLRVRWLLSMRTEFFGSLANFRPQIQNPFENDYRLSRLNRAEASEVIIEPAKRRSISFEDGLVEQLLNDLSTGADELPPPQIQLVCSGLYDGLPDGKTSITRAQYDAAGGATGILREHLTRVLGRDLKPAQRPIAQRLFESLITADGRRAVRTQAELIADFKASQLKDVTPENVQAVLNQLVDSRLLRAQEQEADPTHPEQVYELASGLSPEMMAALTYELAHDYLLDQIKLDPDIQARKAAQELLEQETRTFERYKTLLSPERLAVIVPHRATLRLTPLAEELLAKSEAEVQREQREEEARRQKELDDAHKLAESEKRRAEEQAQSVTRMRTRNRIITVVGALALFAAVVAGILGVLSNQNATRADRNAVTAQVANTQAAENLSAAQAANTQSAINLSGAQTQQAVAQAASTLAERQSRIAFMRQLAAQAAVHRSDQLNLSFLLSLEVMRRAEALGDTFEGRNSLLNMLLPSPAPVAFLNGTPARNMALSPDGTILASGGKDGTITLWDVNHRQPLGETLAGPPGWIANGDLAFSSDGRLLASGGGDGRIFWWDVNSHQRLGPLTGTTSSPISTVAFSPDGQLLASGSGDEGAGNGGLTLWDLAAQQRLGEALTGSGEAPVSVAFSPDGRKVASGGFIGLILWDVASRLQLSETFAGSTGVFEIAFSPDGNTIASSRSDGSGDITLWDVATSQERLTLAGHTGIVYSLAFSPDSQTLASGGFDQTIILWNMATRQQLATLTGHAGSVIGVAFSQDGTLASAGGGSIILWDVSDRPRLGELLTAPSATATNFTFGLTISPDGKLIASDAGNDILLWDMAGQQQSGAPFTDPEQPVLAEAFSPDSRMLASGGNGGNIILWDVANRQRVALLIGQAADGKPLADTVTSVAFSPGGQMLASGSSEGNIILWDVAGRRQLGAPLQVQQGWVISVAFSPDGKTLVSGSQDLDYQGAHVIFWDVAARQPQGEPLMIHGDSIQLNGIALSSDWKILGMSVGDNILLWDVARRQQLGEALAGRGTGLGSVAFSPDGQTLAAVVTNQNSFILWDVASRQPLGQPFVGVQGPIVFSLDGKQLVSGSGLTSASLVLWQVDPQAWKERACQIVSRNFTLAEWNKYFGDRQEPYHKTCDQWPEGN